MAQQNKMYAGDYDSLSDGWPPPSAASAGYSCWQLLTVKQIVGVHSIDGCIPVTLLPKNLIGKMVKVTIEEQL